MKKKRILHIISSLHIGGAEKILLTIISKLGMFEHHVVFFHDGPLRHAIEELGISTYHLKGLFFRYDIVFIIRLKQLIKKINPHLISSSLWAANFFGSLYASFLDIPSICSLHALRAHEGRIRNILDHMSLPRVRHIIAVSHSIAYELHKQHSIASNSITIIPNGIDKQELLSKAKISPITRDLLGIKNTDFVIGSVGRFVKVKNYTILLDCAALLMKDYPAIKVLLVGVGPEYDSLKQQAKSLYISDRVLFIIGEPAYNYYPIFDCFVQPSFYEGLSLALLEALCFSLPVIVTGTNKQHEVIKHAINGLVTTPSSKIELYNALKTVYFNTAISRKLASAGHNTVVQHYTLDNMISSYYTVFKHHIL